MRAILARLTRPPLLFDVLAIIGVILLAIGLLLIWLPACPIVLGVLLVAIAAHAASLTPERQQAQHRPRRRHRIEFLRTGYEDGRELLMPELTDRGKLIDPDEDNDRVDW